MEELKHYGTPRHSGRYPWGSGKDPQQRGTDFLGYVSQLEKQGLTEVEIAKGFGMTTSQLRAQKTIFREEKRKSDVQKIIKLKDKGYSNVAIGKELGINESSVRNLLNPIMQERANETKKIADALKQSLERNNYLDVGLGTEAYLGISRTKLKTSIEMLKEEGYDVKYVKVKQLGTGKYTSIPVLTKPGVEYAEVFKNMQDIKTIPDIYSQDGGVTFNQLKPINNISSNRISIKYAEQGGSEKDGVIEIRRGVEDISLGSSRYAQVRIGVDGTHFLKGMAMYSDDLPKGVDIVFNTNKKEGTPKEDVFKKQKTDDPLNPFGSSIKQKTYIDKDGKEKVSALNIVNEEGTWETWSKKLSSQMLSKQSPALAKQQLDLSLAIKKDELNEIMSLTNPVVKKKLLQSFADDCDSSASHLKAAALPRQTSSVILPFPGMKQNEVYDPNHRNGEMVALIRYPHGGIFEIPTLKVNNKYGPAKDVIQNAKDAIGIHPKVAERLSGADFDGDTVLVIPMKNQNIRTSSPLLGLKNFDPKSSYPAYDGMPKMSAKTKGIKMGDVSNLITDMTIKGASDSEICRAVRHSMVVIDAEKHNLNYKQSYIDNGIAALKKKYQGSEKAGASTLISRSSSEARIPEIKRVVIDPKTGKKQYIYTNAEYVNKQGKTVLKTEKTTKMNLVNDARKLSSGTPIENVYASYANSLKEMANKARKEMVNTKNIEYSPSAKTIFKKEVDSLLSKLDIAVRNKPLERQAQLLANKLLSAKRQSNPNMDADSIKKAKGACLTEARQRVGANKTAIQISDREWKAIQAGAISNNTLIKIIDNTKLEDVKTLATPRTTKSVSQSKEARIRAMLSAGYTQSEVADALGISVSTVSNASK